jgi:hypothetical protein
MRSVASVSTSGQSLQATGKLDKAAAAFGAEDPLEVATRVNPLVTKYVGARVFSFFALIMVVCCVGLLGVSIATWFMYMPVVEDLKNSYLRNGAPNAQSQSFMSFLSETENARILIDSDVAYSTVFEAYPQILSLTTIPTNVSSTDYVEVTRSANLSTPGVVVVDHSTNCLTSPIPGAICDPLPPATPITESSWYPSASEFTTEADSVWEGPDGLFDPVSESLVNSMALIWRTDLPNGNYSLSQMTVNLNMFKLPSDPMLDGSGAERVWLINRDTRNVLTGLGVVPSDYLSLVYDTSGAFSVDPLPLANVSLSDGLWIQQIRNSEFASSELLVIGGLLNDVSASIFPIASSRFSVVCATNSIPFENTTFTSFIVAMMILSAVPVGATLLVWFGYLLRLAAIRKKKLRRKTDLFEINKAMESTKRAKLSKEVMSLGIEAKKGGFGLLRSSAKKKY